MKGSVIKRGDVWYIRFELERDGMGRRRQKTERCEGCNKRQAEERLQKRLVEAREGRLTDSANMTVAGLFEKFLAAQASQLSPTTLELYEITARAHIIPKFGGVKLDKFRPIDVPPWYTHLLTDGKRTGSGGGLSAKSVCNIHGLLHSAMAQAVQWGLLQFNPMDRVTPPKQERTEVKTATPAEIVKLRSALQHHPLRLPFLLILATGMRRGEVCGLQWQDIEGQRLTIRRNAIVAGGSLATKLPKNGKTRVVPLPAAFVVELSGYRLTSSSPWVCPDEDGEQTSPRALGREWKRLTDKLGISIRLHALRHTHATELIMAGLPAKAVSERLGHSDIRITLNTYTHVSETIQDRAAEMVGELWFDSGAPDQ